MQLDLLAPIAEHFEDLPKPAISHADAFLNYTSYQEPVRHGLCSFGDDDDKPEMHTVQRITLPLSSGIKQEVTRYGMKSVEPYTIYAQDKEDTVEKMVLGFLARKTYVADIGKLGSETEAGKWLIEHMQEYYEARLYYRAAYKVNKIRDLEEQIKRLQNSLRIEHINLGIAVREAREGDTITGDARKILARELGATEDDLNR
jgi:hypothetical protein